MSGEILTTVNEMDRADDQVFLSMNGGDNPWFMLLIKELGLKVTFENAEARITHGEEWAILYAANGTKQVRFEAKDDGLPHWLFEELNMIAQESRLRNPDDYEAKYTLKESRGLKAAQP